MRGRIDIKADNVAKLDLEPGGARAFEAADAVRLQGEGLPNALDGEERDAGRFRHGSAGPVRHPARWFAAGQRHHARDSLGRIRRFTGLTRCAVQESFDTGFGKALLPAPDHRPADTHGCGHVLHRRLLGGSENNPRPFDVLTRAFAVRYDRFQLNAVGIGYENTNCLSHAARLARLRRFANPKNASMH